MLSILRFWLKFHVVTNSWQLSNIVSYQSTKVMIYKSYGLKCKGIFYIKVTTVKGSSHSFWPNFIWKIGSTNFKIMFPGVYITLWFVSCNFFAICNKLRSLNHHPCCPYHFSDCPYHLPDHPCCQLTFQFQICFIVLCFDHSKTYIVVIPTLSKKS